MFDNIHEECGVFGIYSPKTADLASSCYYALFALQHRGQESCGIAVNDNGIINCYKDLGLVNEVFTKDNLASLGEGQMAVGHVRYGTMETNDRFNAQPMLVNHIKGCMALAQNGTLTNAKELRDELEMMGSIFHSTSDTEVISYIITKERIAAPTIEAAVFSAMYRLKGAYSMIIMSPSKLVAARDPLGFRPLCIGKKGDQIIFASESCALETLGATFVRDVKPGEIVVVDKHGMRSIEGHCSDCKKALCCFEFIYFARPDSVIEGASVHAARRKAGAFLAKEHPVEADVVIGVPDSGIDAAMGYAEESKIPYGLGFIKNKYIGRSFIQPTQAQRESDVRIKLNTVSETVKGKRVVMIDDSIVRGTTCARIVNQLREAGASEVHVRISAPPFLYPCYFGTDIDSRENLIANNHSIDEIRDIMGADSLGFLGEESVYHIAEKCNMDFCAACFNGKYPIDPPKTSAEYKYNKKIKEKSEDND
ncbi:MAG: amidophosphoribosyltransferase [Oscillospiraceae bacterium]